MLVNPVFNQIATEMIRNETRNANDNSKKISNIDDDLLLNHRIVLPMNMFDIVAHILRIA